MGANLLVPISLAAFVAVVLVSFAQLEPRQAALRTLLGGWLLLPHFDGWFAIPLIASKAAFVGGAVLAGSVALDSARWARLRMSIWDLPIAVLSVEPFFTAVHNDLGAWEGFAASVDMTLTWGAPYLLGRLYFAGPGAIRSITLTLATGALAYVPLALWEIRMSPQIHSTLYGFRPFGFDQVIRFGGYRPSAFMQHGLALSLFMAVGAICAYWLWRTGDRPRILRMPMGTAAVAVAATTFLCKSTGAVLLMIAGIAALEATLRLRTTLLVLALAALPPAYCAARMTGWKAESIVSVIREQIDPVRAASVQFRMDMENLLVKKALVERWLGWGRFGRSFVYSEEGELITVTDSLWVIAVGISGLIGLAAMGAVLFFPLLLVCRRVPARRWGGRQAAPAAALAISLLVWTFDDLLNAMMNPFFPLIAGALVAFALAPRVAPREVRRAPARSRLRTPARAGARLAA